MDALIGKTISAVEDEYGTLRALHFTDGTALTIGYSDDWGTGYDVLGVGGRNARAAEKAGRREWWRVRKLTASVDPEYYTRRERKYVQTLTGFARAYAEEMQAVTAQLRQDSSLLLSLSGSPEISAPPEKRPHARRS